MQARFTTNSASLETLLQTMDFSGCFKPLAILQSFFLALTNLPQSSNQEIYALMAQAGVTANRASFETLLQTVGSSGRLKSAEEVFNEMKVVGVPPRTATYNFLIEACGTAAQPEVQKAFAYVEEMKKTEDAKPNVETYVRLINTASRVS